MTKKHSLYADRDAIQQGQHYIKHVEAMTAEGLHSKADIAAELAHRDIEIERLSSVADAEMKLREGNFAEIERLQAEIKKDLGTADMTVTRLAWEHERFRAALDFYADEYNWTDKYDDMPYCEAERDLGMRARAALKPWCASEPGKQHEN